jgi:hypothetical protein
VSKKLSLEERLFSNHPELLKRFEEIAALVENEQGEIVLADDAEQRAINEVRLLGKEIMNGWARRQSEQTCLNFENKTDDIRRNGKKKSIGKQRLDKSK